MPDTPRTVRECADDADCEGNYSFDGDAPILNALIGAQGRVVYTEEDVEAAANRIPERVTTDCLCGRRYHHMPSFDERKDIARAAITAAGGVVADKVYACREWEASIQREDGALLLLGRGDIVYIVRAEEGPSE